MKHPQAKITYSNVVSTLCLFLLIGGGTAFAANQLAARSVGAKQLKKSAVTTAKLKKNAVTTAKLKAKAVTAAKIKEDAIIGGKIADGAIVTSKISAGAVTGSQIADGAVTGSKVADGTITGADIDAPSTPFSQVVARLRTDGRQSFAGEGVYPIGTYTQAAGEDDQYIGSLTINFAAECTGEREVEAILLRDAPPDVASLEEAIPNIVGAAVIRESGATEETDRILEFASLAGAGSMSSLAPTTTTAHSLGVYLLRGHCGTGSGVTVTGAALDVIGTK